MSAVTYPDDKSILSHIADRMSHMRGGPKVGSPSLEQVAQMLSVAFAASLESEEHRPVSFSLFYTADNYPMNYQFREAAPLTSGALVRLSAALDPTRSSIVVTGREQLEVVGVWHGGSRQVAALSIRVVGAGVFLVLYDAIPILTYRRGQYVAYPGTFDTQNDTGALLSQPAPGFSDEGHDNHSAVCRFRIVEEMLRLGHGGTLLVVPPNADWRSLLAAEGFPPASPEPRVVKTEASAYATWVRRQAAHAALAADDAEIVSIGKQARTEHAGWLLGGYEIRNELAAELDALARLTATDGMVLVLPDLTLLGFGVFFTLGEVDCRMQVHDPYERTPKEVTRLSALGGARHQSAAVAAARLPGALAIVASSDGALTAMRRTTEADPLLVHKHLELRLPPWPVYQ